MKQPEREVDHSLLVSRSR